MRLLAAEEILIDQPSTSSSDLLISAVVVIPKQKILNKLPETDEIKILLTAELQLQNRTGGNYQEKTRN